MAFELHIWGPAFSLPSIDPTCLAVLAYLSHLAKHADEDLQWHVVASNDPSRSPTGELPVIFHDSTAISGLENILDYLHQQIPSRSLSATTEEAPSTLADHTAFTSHILHHGPPLLALSLFVSSENYTTVTRPAYSTLLPWPTQYIVPPRLRTKAQAQTTHLGLTSPDLVDDGDGADSDAPSRRNQSIIPESLRTLGSRRGGAQARPSVTGALTQQPQVGSARFRLDALVDDFCAPLSELLGSEKDNKTRKKKYLFSSSASPSPSTTTTSHNTDTRNTENTSPTSLDCLATAYLSLMLRPHLPQNWLAARIQQRWPTLAAYATTTAEEFWGGGERYTETLPWRAASSLPASSSSSLALLSTTPVVGTIASVAAGALSGIPGLDGWRAGSNIIHPPHPTTAPPSSSSHPDPAPSASSVSGQSRQRPEEQQQQQQPHNLTTVLVTAAVAAAGLAAAAAAAVAASSYPSPAVVSTERERERVGERRNLSEMGEAGALLAGVKL